MAAILRRGPAAHPHRPIGERRQWRSRSLRRTSLRLIPTEAGRDRGPCRATRPRTSRWPRAAAPRPGRVVTRDQPPGLLSPQESSLPSSLQPGAAPEQPPPVLVRALAPAPAGPVFVNWPQSSAMLRPPHGYLL